MTVSDSNLEATAAKVREWRIREGLTQKAAGELFNPPVQQPNWTRMERGLYPFSPHVLEQLADLCGERGVTEKKPPPVVAQCVTKMGVVTRVLGKRPNPDNAAPAWRWIAQLSEAEGAPERLSNGQGIVIAWTPTKHLEHRVTLRFLADVQGLTSEPVSAVVTMVRGERVVRSDLADSIEEAVAHLQAHRSVAAANGWDRPREGVNRVLAAVIAWCAAAQCRRLK